MSPLVGCCRLLRIDSRDDILGSVAYEPSVAYDLVVMRTIGGWVSA